MPNIKRGAGAPLGPTLASAQTLKTQLPWPLPGLRSTAGPVGSALSYYPSSSCHHPSHGLLSEGRRQRWILKWLDSKTPHGHVLPPPSVPQPPNSRKYVYPVLKKLSIVFNNPGVNFIWYIPRSAITKFWVSAARRDLSGLTQTFLSSPLMQRLPFHPQILDLTDPLTKRDFGLPP
ncbi:uncharacterized protein LOC144228768 [Crocuta crocuta]